MAAIAEAQLEQCIDKLYGALTAPDTLVDAIRAVRLTFEASGATHLHFSADGELQGFVDDGHDPASQRLYVEHYAALDPTRTLLDLRAGQWLRDDRLLDPRHTRQPEFVNDFAPRIGMRWFLGCKLYDGNRGTSSFSLQRGIDARPFDDETFTAMRQLQPHLKRVFRMSMDMAPAFAALASANAAVDMLRMPVCVVDKDCRIIYANPAAEELLARGEAVKVTSGRLWCTRPDADQLLCRAVSLASRQPRKASAFSPEPEASAVTRLQIRAVPLAPQLPLAQYGHGNLVLLFLARGSPPPQPYELQQLFGLTQAEAELVRLLAQGAHPDLCAARRGVSIATVRTQLQSVYAKTGAGSQAQLLSIVLALPALR